VVSRLRRSAGRSPEQEVDLELGDARVHLRLREAVCAAEREEVFLELASVEFRGEVETPRCTRCRRP